MPSLSHSLPRFILAMLIVAMVTVVASPRPQAAAIPLAVEYGVTGQEDLSTWVQTDFVPTTMVSSSTETMVFLGFRTTGADLEARAEAVSDPVSPFYGDHLPVAVNAERYNATDEQVQTVVDWFATRDVTVAPDATRSFVQATVSIAVLEELTGAVFGAFVPADQPTPSPAVLVSPVTAISTITPELASSIDRVAGVTFIAYPEDSDLDVSSLDRRSLPASPASDLTTTSDPTAAWSLIAADGGTPWRTGTPIDACPEALAVTDFGHSMGISPAQLRTAYGVDQLWDQGFRGRGARIAVVNYAPYLPSDLATWRSCFGLEGTPITDHVMGPLLSDPSQRLETILDLQAVVSIAPEAERIDWFGVPSSAPTMVGSLTQLLAPAFDASLTGGVAPDVINASFAVCEPEILGRDPSWEVGVSLFNQMVATGVASGIGTFVATGDHGSTGCFPTTDYVSVSFPASSRWVTAVGGTNLTLDTQNNNVSSGVWNDARFASPPLPIDSPFDGGGGGFSLMEPMPTWQSGIAPVDARTVPDVSHFADALPGSFLFFEGRWSFVGGTSLASPLLATSFALQSAALAERGEPRLGFVAPLLYAMASNPDPAASGILVDVLLGKNDPHSAGVYDAAPGYDMASGLGWVRQDALFDYLNHHSRDPVPPAFTG
jgi:subtilase family serine protease